MRGSEFVAVTIQMNAARSEKTLRKIEERLWAAELAGEADNRTRRPLQCAGERRQALGAE